MTLDSIVCSDCGAEINVANDIPLGRIPCSSCGGKNRTTLKSLDDSVNASSGLRAVGYVTSKTKWFIKLMSEPSFTRFLGKWSHRLKIENKRADEYLEIVTVPETGEVLHKCQEPLSEHRGHGSAKIDNTNKKS